MGSGYIMNAYALNALKNLDAEECKKALEALGTDWLTDVFGAKDLEDFETRSKVAAEMVRLAVQRDFEQKLGKDYPFSVDVVEKDGKFKVSFFK